MDIGLGEISIAIVSFVAGRLFVQSEAVLVQKKKVYQEYLDNCLTAQDAYKQFSDSEVPPSDQVINLDNIRPKGEFFLYASQEVIVLAGQHVETLGAAFNEIDQSSEALHPAFTNSVQAYNRMLMAMRKDVLGWSIQGLLERIFGYGRARKLLKTKSG
jgi:hypothetical protein